MMHVDTGHTLTCEPIELNGYIFFIIVIRDMYLNVHCINICLHPQQFIYLHFKWCHNYKKELQSEPADKYS